MGTLEVPLDLENNSGNPGTTLGGSFPLFQSSNIFNMRSRRILFSSAVADSGVRTAEIELSSETRIVCNGISEDISTLPFDLVK